MVPRHRVNAILTLKDGTEHRFAFIREDANLTLQSDAYFVAEWARIHAHGGIVRLGDTSVPWNVVASVRPA